MQNRLRKQPHRFANHSILVSNLDDLSNTDKTEIISERQRMPFISTYPLTEGRRKMIIKAHWLHHLLAIGAIVSVAATNNTQLHADDLVGLPLSLSMGVTAETDSNVTTCSSYDSCCCGSACCENSDRLLGLFAHSEPCFDKFISPMTNPVFFEDPRTLTEARAIFLQHRVPTAAGGGEIQVMAVQLRAALTDRLSLIATKDGFATSSNALVADGWADMAMGLKYNLFADAQSQQLLSTGFTYEMPIGTPRTLQGNGDGEFHLFLTGGMEIFDYGHWISASGFRLPSDPNAESSMWYWSNHFDYEVADGWYLLTEFNWFNWIGSGTGGIPGVEGGDLFNFGSTGVAGNDIVTNAVGLKYKHSKHSELGLAFEYPLTQRQDVLKNRLTVDWIFRY